MLKIQKAARNHSVNLTFREREPFLDSFLLKAFWIAFAIHLLIFLIFHIQPFIIKAEFLYPPIKVQTDSPILSNVTLLHEETIERSTSIPEPPLSLFLNELAFEMEPPIQLFEEELELWQLPFDAIEKHLVSYTPPALPITRFYAPIQLFISGDLAYRSLKKNDSRINKKLPLPAITESHFASYKVQIDPSTGLIFWYELQRSTGHKAMDALTEELLLSLEFEPSNSSDKSVGTIDFVLQDLENL